ncbi:DUF6429 family protein [Pseudomonas frederiksbergensis]|uniref:DUF6429 family protein n=1 Tax=Pseudomonas frederiksbergensis TaxID=104087 RepID=UPI001F3CFFC2|nr:DUF6429 family protein [Pseudomonas frederiksbergensis]
MGSRKKSGAQHPASAKRFEYGVHGALTLHEHGFISNPVNKNKSIWLTAEGLERGRQIADRLFGVRTQGEHASNPDT